MENKSTTAVEFHGPSSSGASQEQPDPSQLIQLKRVGWKVLDTDKNRQMRMGKTQKRMRNGRWMVEKRCGWRETDRGLC